ncbi:hypothetical protein JCM10213_004778 [Rhodosporidiobolus nylandii]
MLRSIASTSARVLRAPATLPPAASRSFSSSPSPRSPPPPKRPQPQPPSQPSEQAPHLTAQEAADKSVEERDTKPAPYLSRALGVKQKPVPGRKQTREEWRADLLSREKRLDERRHLVKQVSKGYFHDYNELRGPKGGKAFIAPKTLIREDLSLYFPDIEGTSLATKEKVHTTNLFEGKVSLVAFSSVRASEEHVNSFVRPALSDMKDEPDFQYVYINLQENPLKSFLVSMFISSLRKTVPKEYHSTYLLSHQSLEYLRGPLGMENQHVGSVFLVDWNGKIRWAGCGWATVEEEEALRRCSHVLVERLKQQGGKA